MFDDLVELLFPFESYHNDDFRLSKVNFFDVMCVLIKNQDVMMSNVGSGESEAKKSSGSFVEAMLVAEAASVSARPTVGLMNPRKQVREEEDAEVGSSAYLEELD